MAIIGGATLNQTPLDWKHNSSNIISAIESAQSNSVEILCLPELCITGYGCEDMFLSDWIYERALSELLLIAPYCRNIFVAIGVPIQHNGQKYNCVCVIENAVIIGIVAKQFLANDGVHYEPRWFTPWVALQTDRIQLPDGKTVPFGDLSFKHKGFHIGFEICEDAWRSNRPACRLRDKGVNLIFNPSASHFAFGKSELRQELVLNSSKDFNCTYVYANLLGNEAGRMIYDGEIIIASHGELYAKNQLLSYRNFNLSFLAIAPDAKKVPEKLPRYQEDKFEIFAKAATLGLYDYARKSKSNGFVLSLSGGADSSTCAVLVSEMIRRAIEELGEHEALTKLGAQKTTLENSISEFRKNFFTTAYQGTKNSSSETLNAAQALAAEIGAAFYNWLIDDQVNVYIKTIEENIGRSLSWEKDDITLQNIQARARSPIIWMLSNLNNALLLTTSNRSEGDVGYTTMDGDTSGSLAPIAAVDKDFIIQWLRWAETKLGYKSLSHVNSLKPTAELRPLEYAQTDEKDLMPYTILVQIERLAIRDKKSPKDVYQKLQQCSDIPPDTLKEYVRKFFRLWARNQWKRERIAPAFHLDDFNVDPRTWCRFPILSSSFKEELDEL